MINELIANFETLTGVPPEEIVVSGVTSRVLCPCDPPQTLVTYQGIPVVIDDDLPAGQIVIR